MTDPVPEVEGGFSLVELLAVMAIIVIMLSLILPASPIGRAGSLTSGANAVADQIELARQIALAQNRVVEMRFYELKDATGGNQAFRATRLFQLSDSGDEPRPLGNLKRLPDGVIMDRDFSTVLREMPEAKEILGDKTATYRAIEFRPGGTTNLNANGARGEDTWYVSFKLELDRSIDGLPARNFITAQINPLTGRVTIFRPGV